MVQDPSRPIVGATQSGPDTRRSWGWAKLAWILPLVGLAFLAVGVSCPDRPSGFVAILFLVLIFIGQGCIFAGIVFTIIAFAFTKRYSNALRNGLGGCAVLVGAALAILAFLCAVLVSLGHGTWR